MISKANWTNFSGIYGGQVLPMINRVLPPWVSLLLVVAIAWQIAKMIWMMVPGPAAGDSISLPPAAQQSSAPTMSDSDVQSIANAHMFGIPGAEVAEAVPVPTDEENLTDTGLTNLALKGTVASRIPEFSIAVISDGNKEEKVYAIDDPIGANAKLHAVYADRVVLNENGVLTNLKLPKEFADGVPASMRRSTSSLNRSVTSNQESIQAVVSKNINKLSDVIRPTPYFVNGQQNGYRVYPGRNRQQFSDLGLRPGDLIKDVDGQALTDPTQAMQIFQTLGSSEQVTVTVERNGQPETIVLRTSQLDLSGEQTE